MDVQHSDGSFDLTPLMVGSQGTLGIVTEITLETELHNPETTLLVAAFDELQHLQSAVLELRDAADMPSAIELVDGNLLTLVSAISPNQLKGIIDQPYPKFVVLVEYDSGGRLQKKATKKAAKILNKYASNVQVETDFEKQEVLWKIRQASATAAAHATGSVKALPIVEDGVVPVDKLQEYITGMYKIFERTHLQPAIWGHIGSGNLHMRPYLDLSQLGDRQKAFKIMDDYYALIIELGGTVSGEHGDGRLRAPYLEKMYGKEVYELFQKVKKIFDPYGTLNPGVKMGTSSDDLKALLRHEYSISHLYEHLPRS